MNASSFDRVSKLLARRRLPRRRALAQAGAGLATGEKIFYLFVQSFQQGSVAPKEDDPGRFTVTLEHGLGQTIYFADRPSRDVGAVPTPRFLDGLGFAADNPPNAALVVETGSGTTDIAVVEMFSPVYDEATHTATYDVAVLANWENSLEMGFSAAPTDLAALAPRFGAAHLFIDDCPTKSVVRCNHPTNPAVFLDGPTTVDFFRPVDTCWNYGVCMPCEPYGHTQPSRCATQEYWGLKCNQTYAACQNKCYAHFDWAFADC